MIDKLPLKVKLSIITAVPVIALVIVTIFSMSTVNNVFDDMKNSIFEEHLKSSTLILNADRDMYQALTAMQEIIFLKDNAEQRDALVDDFNENIEQVKERTLAVKSTMENNQGMWEQVKDSSNATVFENFSFFETDFNGWIDICNSMISTQELQDGWIEKFNASREYINLIGESIEQSSETEMSRILNEKNAMILRIITIDIIALLIAIILSIVFLVMVSKSLLKLRQAADKIALGDVDIDINIRSNDEIGKLSIAFREMAATIKEKADMAERIARGDLNVSIEPKSQKDVLSISMKSVVGTLNSLVSELSLLTSDAVDGKLDTRGNSESFKGGYKNIVQGVNSILDAVIKPVKEVMDVLGEVSKGKLDLYVKGDYKGDYKKLKDMMNETINILHTYVDEISRILIQMAEGNLDVNITVDYKGDFVEIKDSLENIIGSFNGVLGEISSAADQVSSGSRQVSDSSQALSQGSTEQASSMEELTASINDIADQTKKNASNANQANEFALSANENASQGNNHMKEMLKAMQEINESSSSISKIIKVIDEIAFQTNILALNAAVEAARAGQHGKGFAVVAEEVRNLAARSANAAKETTSLIEGSIQKVDIGMRKANDTASALNMIVEGVTKVSNLVGNIAEASNDQATGISQVNQGIEQVSEVIQTNSATAEQSAAASQELSSQADILKDMVSKFKFKTYGNSSKVPRELSPDIVKLLENVTDRDIKKKVGSQSKKSLCDIDLGKY